MDGTKQRRNVVVHDGNAEVRYGEDCLYVPTFLNADETERYRKALLED